MILPKQAFSTEEIGRRFLSYYQKGGYEAIPGSSLLDPSVPMSFVMSAGLVQVETSASCQGGRTGDRYALLQNCFRYFDLDKVGRSDTHLSLFQMPGAFAFGPVDKRERIARIWSLLTQVYALCPETLWVTYFAGGEVAGHPFPADVETQQAWQSVGLDPRRIVGLGAEENFWKQGASVVGEEHVPKCGPNTEVFFDRGPQRSCGPGCRPGCGCGRFVEFLNTLFITWHIDDASGVVRPLEEPFTETVIGTERVALLLQGVDSVFDIDSIRPLVDHVHNRLVSPAVPAEECRRCERVLADHVRALLFLKADGASSPGKGGRARLMRKLVRGMLTCEKLLGLSGEEWVPSLVELAGALCAARHAPVLSVREGVLQDLEQERQRFEETLRAGRRCLERMLRRRERRYLSGEEMLELEKHYGVPVSLQEVMLQRRRVQYSRQDYQRAYVRWRRALVGSH
ncbi:MAG: hypothetical protein JXA37_03750 [Chloroflexia bacterium]|nr:hypothetical protein [Chloroflexia bacterium]